MQKDETQRWGLLLHVTWLDITGRDPTELKSGAFSSPYGAQVPWSTTMNELFRALIETPGSHGNNSKMKASPFTQESDQMEESESI